ncbi:MAG TPA: rhodanese-like domain-containing protein, partial [Methanomicrobiales archaeon]|nr:rhodanese-like domain-containing protein [Methanomicrobiales archaeon]
YLEPLTIPKVKQYQERGAQLIDIRSPTAFAGGHIPGSINIWREGLTSFMGYVLTYEDPVILIHDYQDLDSVSSDFARMGYDNLAGFLASGFSTWHKGAQEIETTATWGVQDLQKSLEDPSLFILDVRDIKNRNDFGYIPHSRHIYIGHLEEHIREVPEERHVVVYCDSGFKGSMGASILQKHGYRQVTNLLGGTTAWMNAHYTMEKD